MVRLGRRHSRIHIDHRQPRIQRSSCLRTGLDHVKRVNGVYRKAGGLNSVDLAANSACLWSVQSDVPWIRAAVASGSGSVVLSFSVDVNATGLTRSGTLTIGGNPVTVIQAGI